MTGNSVLKLKPYDSINNILDKDNKGIWIYKLGEVIKISDFDIYKPKLAEIVNKEVSAVNSDNDNHKLELIPMENSNGMTDSLIAVRINENQNGSNEIIFNEGMKNILEASYDGIFITDGKGVILYSNNASERINGLKKEDVIGKQIQDLLNKGLFSDSAVLEVMKHRKRVTLMGYNYLTNKKVLLTGTPSFDEFNDLQYVVINIRDMTELTDLINKLQEKDRIIDSQKVEIDHLRSMSSHMFEEGVIAASPAMVKAFELVRRVARYDSTVLILGESGSGKEVVAQEIVKVSERKGKPYIKVNCGAIPENLLESELFGYEKGAFTGASQKGKMGLFEIANKGTLLLDEVAELSLGLQVKLLRAIQQKEIMRLGGTSPIKLDVRVIAATNRDIEAMVKNGAFREDLFYRLNVVTIRVPPLRDRKEDIPQLAAHFFKMFSEKYNVQKSMSPKTLDAFCLYSWPGNVRQLENTIESLIVLSQGDVINVSDLPTEIMGSFNSETGEIPAVVISDIIPLNKALGFVEKELIEKAVKKYGSTRKAAAVLGVDQSTIVRKMNKNK